MGQRSVLKPLFNLTPKRVEALRFIQKHPDCYVGAVAEAVLVGEYRRKNNSGFWSQMATRSGAGYCQKLRDAGLITINTHTDYGYGRVRLTQFGEDTLKDSDSLDAAIARSVE